LIKKLETSFCRVMQNAFQQLERFRRGSRVGQMDGQTETDVTEPSSINLEIGI